MTATEINNVQEAFVISLGFSIEFSLAVIFVLVIFTSVLWLYSIKEDRFPKRGNN